MDESTISPQTSRRPIFYGLTGSLALYYMGGSLLSPIFALKISQLGRGVETFGWSAIALSLTALVAAPYLGSLADKLGRRIIFLSALIVHAGISIAYLLAPTWLWFIGARALCGVFSAGLAPAKVSMVGDLASREERGRWLGFVDGWSALGFVVGPPLGGWLYNQWGLAVPFIAAAGLHILAFLLAFARVPETLKTRDPGEDEPEEREPGLQKRPDQAPARLWDSIPRPYSTFGMLLVISFMAVFAWRFTEPQFHFFIYDELGWTSTRFGLTISGYAILLMVAETTLGHLSDRFGRKPVLMIGLVLHCAQYIALVASGLYIPIALGIALSGLGEGVFMPALNAYFLDITPERIRARVMGFKEAAFTLGGLTGPLLVVFLVKTIAPREIFIISAALLLVSALLVPLLGVRKRSQSVGEDGRAPKTDIAPY